ncbi:MAG: hypothetical protein JW800_03470 [Candidatus Omnitrophica bacterium]|nr:hypothetical protein [Candidatus Omnitrophota bacterium]
MSFFIKSGSVIHKKIFMLISAVTLLYLLAPTVMAETAQPKIELKGNDVFIDGKKFFVKGIGYSPYRPGQSPGEQVPIDLVEKDFARIKEAGFNTIRTWDMLSDKQLELARKYGLKVIQATYLQPNVDFGYSGFIRTAESKVRYMCKKNKDEPNIIMYLVMNEPHSQSVVESGVDKTIELYRNLVRIAKEEDPKRPVSMANAFWTLWLDQSMWDVVSFNTYSYCPPADEIGYGPFVENLKNLHAKDRPFVVTEMGLSVSPVGKDFYGGNSYDAQANGLVENFRGLVNAGAIGGCIFEWNDEWWKAGNPEAHDSHAEEWFGILGTEDDSNPAGTPRKAYYSLKDEFMLTVVNPKDGQKFADGHIGIEVHSSGELKKAEYRIDEGKWRELSRDEEWYLGKADVSSAKEGLHTLSIRGIGKEKQYERRLNIIKCAGKDDLVDPIKIELITDKDKYKCGDTIYYKVKLTKRDGAPLADYKVKLGIFDTASAFLRKWEDVTDQKGIVERSIPALGSFDRWYYVVWAGTEADEYGYKRRLANMRYLTVERGDGMPKKQLTASKAADPIVIDGVLEEAWSKTEVATIDPNLVCQEGNICELSDLSAKVRVMWDKDFLYIACDVTDDLPMKQDYEKIDLWKGDGVELFVSVKPEDIPEKGYSQYDFQILIGANGNMWIPAQTHGGIRNKMPVSSKAVAKKTDKGYILEAKISAKNFEQKSFTNFEVGDILGFNIGVDDKDLGEIREGVIVWNGTPIGYKNSSVWGRLKLGDVSP